MELFFDWCNIHDASYLRSCIRYNFNMTGVFASRQKSFNNEKFADDKTHLEYNTYVCARQKNTNL